MRVVVDTNVLVSGVFFGGPPGRVLEVWRDGLVDLVVSKEILAEYVRVGERLSEGFPGVDLEPVLHDGHGPLAYRKLGVSDKQAKALVHEIM